MARRRPKGRPVHGILLLDKPSGITSNAALQAVKQLFFANKAGHTGSLDPLASGLLPVCMGAATKISGFLLDADKRYQVTCQLGIKTATGDSDGEVLETRPVEIYTQDRLEAVIDSFRGLIQQVPPMYSALKHKGQRLYSLARKGIEVEREPREVTIHEMRLTAMSETTLELDIHCSKGTYVRTLVEDIGEILGCGAHVSRLRRTSVGPYNGLEEETAMVTLDTLEEMHQQDRHSLDSLLLPLESALTQWPEVNLTSDAAFYVQQGQPVLVPHVPTEGWVRLYEGQTTFLGMGEILDDGRVAPRRLMKAG